jgi:hypothetical protein
MNPIKSVDDFKKFIIDFKQKHGKPFAYGIGIAFKNSKDRSIGFQWYSVNKDENLGTAASLMHILQIKKNFLFEQENIALEIGLITIDKMLNEYLHVFNDDGGYHPNIEALKNAKAAIEKNVKVEAMVIFYAKEETLKKQILGVEDATFRLALISQSKYKKDEICLDRIDNIVPNLAWTKEGPFSLKKWDSIKSESKEKPVIAKIPPKNWSVPTIKKKEVVNE